MKLVATMAVTDRLRRLGFRVGLLGRGLWARLDQPATSLTAGLAVLIPLAILLAPTNWVSNEDTYFLLSYRTFAPERFHDLSASFDASRSRFLYSYLTGGMIHLLGYDGAHVIQRLLLIVSYAVSIGFVVARLGLSPADGFLLVALFYFFGPDLMGGEWLFNGVEAKTFAYVFAFFAMGACLSGRYRRAAILFAAATYFHFLVGGFWAVTLLGVFWLMSKRRADILRPLVLYGCAVMPLVVITLQDQLSNAPTPDQLQLGVSATYVYSIVRAPLHVAPFADPEALGGWARGAIACGALLVSSVVAIGTSASRIVRLLAGITAAASGFLLVAFGLSYLDRHTGALGPLYLFRPSSLTLVVALLLALRLSRDSPRLFEGGGKLIVAVFVGVLFLGIAIPKKVRDYLVYRDTAATVRLVAAEVRARTAADDVVLVQPVEEGGKFSSLPRLLERPTLVSWKFIPTTPREILYWYALEQYRSDWFERGCASTRTYPVKFLLVLDRSQAPSSPCGETVWESGPFALIRVEQVNGLEELEVRR